MHTGALAKEKVDECGYAEDEGGAEAAIERERERWRVFSDCYRAV